MLRPRGADDGGLEWRITPFPISTTIPASPSIRVGVKEFMCMGASPPMDHPHIFIDMGARRKRSAPIARPASSMTALSAPMPTRRLRMARDGLTPMTRALIAGAGVAGLAAALALAKAGFRPAVRARRRRWRSSAPGCSCRPIARACSRELGALEAVAVAGHRAARDPHPARPRRGRARARSTSATRARAGARPISSSTAPTCSAASSKSARASPASRSGSGRRWSATAPTPTRCARPSGAACDAERGRRSAARRRRPALQSARKARPRRRRRAGFSGRVAFRATVEAPRSAATPASPS